MPLYRPSELRDFLEANNLQPKKGLSQNFLIDGNVLRKLVDLANVLPHDLVIEIGPGPGVLTEELLKRGADVIAIEKDTKLAAILPRLDPSGKHLTTILNDVMDVSFQDLVQGNKKAKVVANIPYQLTTPIFEKIIEAMSIFDSATLLVQEEVARRCVAQGGSADYSPLSFFLQYHATVSYGFLVQKSCFYPAPSVDSAVLHLKLGKRFPVRDENALFAVVKKAFGQRRKMLTSSLKGLYSRENIVRALQHIHKREDVRPEELDTKAWVDFFKELQNDSK